MKDKIFVLNNVLVVRVISDPIIYGSEIVVVVDELVDALGESKELPLRSVSIENLRVI